MNKKEKLAIEALANTVADIGSMVSQLMGDITVLDDRLINIEEKAGLRDNEGYPVKNSGIPCIDRAPAVAPMPTSTWNNPFAGHESYVEMLNAPWNKDQAKSPNTVMVGMYFGDDGKHIDGDIPITICDNGVFTAKNDRWEKVEVTAPLFVGTIERPTGMYVSTDVSLEGAKQARDFLDSIIEDKDYAEYVKREKEKDRAAIPVDAIIPIDVKHF